ncbi:elongator complex protein 6 isoform X2 [Vidua chalybeata]|uniref:elongator complex protein 6 isoform X2 n=1 Tax=Vidua chalybeata TaxID=81927 RepID=UPI0023A7DD78|nr:elongator complex protein 6 isoform X2 [Vidua chalybeata]
MAASWCTTSSPSTSELAARFALWPCSSPSATTTSWRRSWQALVSQHRRRGHFLQIWGTESLCVQEEMAEAKGVSLAAAKERGQLVFLEGLKSCLDLLFGEEEQPGQPSPLQFLSGSTCDLRALFDFVRVSLSAADSWKGPVLLVDDLSVLLSLGAAPVAVLDFIHYCRVCVCCQLKGNVVVLVHSNEDSEDEENELVVNSLCHHSDLILWAEGLATGFCKDVHGQIKIIKRLSLRQAAEQDLVQIYQYKIQDRNVTFFARGLSAAVL